MTFDEQGATIRMNKRAVREMIADLEASLGADSAYPATRHAAALYGELAVLERSWEARRDALARAVPL